MAEGPEASIPSDWSEKLVAQAEKSWTVSGTSVLSAWLMAFVGSVLILLLFSWRRRKDAMTHLPRYLALIHREPTVTSKRVRGEWHPYIPTSDPSRRPQERYEEETAHTKSHRAKEEKTKNEKREDQVGGKLNTMEEGENFFAWLRPGWRDFLVELNILNRKGAKERDKKLLDYLGLDAFTFLEFLRLLRWLFALITVFVALPLICANYFINTRTDWGSTTTSISASGDSGIVAQNLTSAIGDLQLFTAANIKGNGLWVHISAEIAVTMIVFLQVKIYSTRHERVIEIWSDMNASEVAFKTIMITGLNIPSTSGSGKSKTRHTTLHAKSLIKAKIGLPPEAEVEITIKQEKMGELAEKIKRWNEVERKKVAARLQRWADKREKREYEGWWEWCKGEGWKSNQQVFKEALYIREARRKDQLEHRERENTEKLSADVTAAFVTWRTAKAAHLKLQSLTKNGTKGFKAERCPRSVCVLWRNLEKDPSTIAKQRITGAIARWGITLLNSVPVMFITLLTNLDAYIDGNDKLRTMRENSTFWNAVFTAAAGIIPASVAALFIMALPYVMRFLSQWQGALSRGQLDKDVIRQMFIFLLLSKFVFFSLLGIAYETYQNIKDQIGQEDVKTIVASLGDVPAKITRAYISQSSYWLSFFPIKCAVVCLQMMQLPRYLLKFWEFYVVRAANTRDRLEEAAQPAEFEVTIEYTNILFGLVVALVYTPLAPIVSVCGAMYFWTASIVYQNQLTFVEETVETDGKVWRVVMNRLLAALSFMQILMILTVLLKTQPFAQSNLPLVPRIAPTILAALPLVITAYLARHIHTRPTAAQIISDRERSIPSSNPGFKGVPKFDLDILRSDAIKPVKVFPWQEDLFVELSKQKGWKGLEKVVPQVKWRKRELEGETKEEVKEKKGKRRRRGRRK